MFSVARNENSPNAFWIIICEYQTKNTFICKTAHVQSSTYPSSEQLLCRMGCFWNLQGILSKGKSEFWSCLQDAKLNSELKQLDYHDHVGGTSHFKMVLSRTTVALMMEEAVYASKLETRRPRFSFVFGLPWTCGMNFPLTIIGEPQLKVGHVFWKLNLPEISISYLQVRSVACLIRQPAVLDRPAFIYFDNTLCYRFP